MGGFGSKNLTPQILIAGPEGAGKTHLLYQKRIPGGLPASEQVTPTIGFNYEEIEEKIIQTDKKVVAGFWDVGGGEATQLVYTAIC